MWVQVIIALAGAAISAYGSYKSGKAAKKAGELSQGVGESQGQLADYNAQVADLQAEDALRRGADDEQRFRTRVRGAIGAQRVDAAAGNIDVNVGSPVDVQADAAMLGELDALTIRTNAAREAWGFKVQAQDSRARGKIVRKEGANAAEIGRVQGNAAYLQGASSLVGTAGSLLEARYGMGRR